MARPHHSHLSLLLLLLRLLLLLPAATATSYSSLCHSPAAAKDAPVPIHSRGAPRLALPWVSTGHFSRGADLHFAPGRRSSYTRAFSFSPRDRSARATADPAVVHLSATLTLEGTRLNRRYGDQPHSVSFDLDGYYSTATPTAELCMVGSGSYAREDGFGVVLLSDVVLRLHVPRPSNLTRPFVTGSLGGADFNPISLVAYAEDDYEYGNAASCPPPPGARQVLGAGFSCGRLRALLGRSYSLEHMPNGHAASGFPLRLRHGSMYINQMRCAAADGAVRAYMVFYTHQPGAFASNYTARRWRRGHAFVVGDEALVADGFWDSSRSRLCLRACRVASSSQSSADLDVRECGIGVSFWFPAAWSIQDRSVVAGMIWNLSGDSDGNTAAVISVSRTGSYMDDLSSIKYNYTRVEEAKKHYYNSMPALSKERKGRFPSNYSYRDFEFEFILKKQGLTGYASPVTIGSALVEGGRLIADAAFEAEEVNRQRLLNVSYSLQYQAAYVNSSANSAQLVSISAEGVYDTKTGSLCMVACQVINASSDCEVLVTVQFAPVDYVSRERAVGTISSLRKQGDPLFFEALDFVGDGMYVQPLDKSISRMDMESIMVVVSMVLSCVFTALQLRHVKKHPEALPATSITMLVVLAIGYVIPLVLNLEDMYRDSRKLYFLKLTSGGSLELNEFMLRVSTMLAFLLQLRLLQLALSSRSADQAASSSKHEDSSSSSSDSERSTLWICLPLYALGAVVVWIVHMSDGGHHAFSAPPGPALVDDLAAYAGLILDGFLLPQVVWNAFSGSKAARALSPWFYAGGSVIRAAPHVYDVLRKQSYVPSRRPSYVYASHRDDLFGVGWDVAIPCGAASLAALLFLQQRRGGAFLCCSKSRQPGEYEMVSTVSS
ncbi:hypothetical protein BAE44_0016683 [Dichanthelium oligosanthes]|uniref:RING-type E3 ubiquitin transferase n=1 Tax=Dichanthelium oligosanthes TaxID=888268 RepID=A0A1E5VAY4_9POAL|nr:hypothetical protein BAE44_0016683 [Dichanthelium oligosanthes]